MKQYAAERKWTKGRSRIVRVTDQSKLQRGLLESIKMTMDRLPGSARKKRSWEK